MAGREERKKASSDHQTAQLEEEAEKLVLHSGMDSASGSSQAAGGLAGGSQRNH